MPNRPLHGLYAILDTAFLRGRDPLALASALLEGGARTLQLRDKKMPFDELLTLARQLRTICVACRATILINDHVFLARESDADGVHLGQTDMPVWLARTILGPDKIIGLSTHNREQALAAASLGADYLGFGPIFATATKARAHPPLGLGEVGWAARILPIPWVAIGGIALDNVGDLVQAGAGSIAVISALMDAADSCGAAQAFSKALATGSRG